MLGGGQAGCPNLNAKKRPRDSPNQPCPVDARHALDDRPYAAAETRAAQSRARVQELPAQKLAGVQGGQGERPQGREAASSQCHHVPGHWDLWLKLWLHPRRARSATTTRPSGATCTPPWGASGFTRGAASRGWRSNRARGSCGDVAELTSFVPCRAGVCDALSKRTRWVGGVQGGVCALQVLCAFRV